MSRIFIAGLGAVSPAGWGVTALREALGRGEPLPTRAMERPGWTKPLRVRDVPAPVPRLAFLAHPRLRRAAAVAQYAAGAAVEAMAGINGRTTAHAKVGLIVCLQSGCLQYSCRYFDEVLKEPATASPLLFPETVFAAPASHIAADLESVTRATTIVGDPSAYLAALALGGDWLLSGEVELALIVGADETHWMHADAAWHLDHGTIIASGAGALVLARDPDLSIGAELVAITEPARYSNRVNRTIAALAMRRAMPTGAVAGLLCDGTQNLRRTDAPENAAWRDWPGHRWSPRRVLGEGQMAGAAWQCVAAAEAISRGEFSAACVSVVGCNQHATGARFVRHANQAGGGKLS